MAAALGALMVGALVNGAAPASADVRSNTSNRLPYNLYLGDINGDGSADLMQVAANKLFAFRSDYSGTPILRKYFDQTISRVVTGDFTTGGREHGKDQVCAIFTDGQLGCYAISDDGTDLWWWFSQASFIAADEQAIVGDFDGDGADDILVYKPSTGAIRAYTRMIDGYFRLMPSFSLGNLASADRVNKKLLAGEFGQATNRSDLLLFDPASGQVSRYDSVTDASGTRTFWWAFTTATGTTSADEDLQVARVENTGRDGIVLRDRVTGSIRLKRAEYASGGLASVSGVSRGQLPVTTDSGRLLFAKLGRYGSEPGGTIRDDALFFNYDTGTMRRVDARYDGSQYTYWWAFDKARPALNTGWSGVTNDPWTVVLCKFSDVSTLPQGTTFWRDQFTAGRGGVGDFYWDMSYGSRNIHGTRVLGPYQMTVKASATMSRSTAGTACRNAATAAGASVPSSKVIYYVNADTDEGAFGSNILANTAANSPTYLGHEMGHVYGLNDSADDRGTWYGDPYDVMSAMNVYCFGGSAALASADNACASPSGGGVAVSNTAAGPGFNAGNRIAAGLLPSGRVRLLTPGSSTQTVSVDVTALDRPEASATAGGAVQAIRIPIPSGALSECVPGNTCNTTGNYYTVELREPRAWDRSFTGTTVFVHKVGVTNGMTQTYLKTSPVTQFSAGSTYQDTNVTIRVNSISTARGVANVSITY